MRANKKVDIHNHHMAVGAKLTKKPYATAVREKHLQCGYESHQVTKLLWCRWWTGGCAVMSYLAAVARCDCSHLLQVVSTSDRPTSTQTLWAQAKNSHRPFTVIMTSLHHPVIKPIHQTSRRGTDSLSATQNCVLFTVRHGTFLLIILLHWRLNRVITRCDTTLQHVINVIFFFILTTHNKTVFICRMLPDWYIVNIPAENSI